MNNQFIIPILFVTIVAIAVIISIYFSAKNEIKRILKKLPDSRIINLKKGEFSRITGKALHAEAPFIAPYSQRKCVFYTIKIEQKQKSGKSSHWDTLVNDKKIQPFFIEKNGDMVLIKPTLKPKNYKSYLVVDKETSSGTFNNASDKFKQVLEQYDIDSEGFLGFNKTLRYKETIIEIGEEITVAGIADWKTLHEPIEGYSYSKIATLKSTPNQKLIITDLDKNNFSNT